MEDDSQYFTAVARSGDLDGEVTILVDENGEMILDLTQALSTVNQQEEGENVIIITGDLCDTQGLISNERAEESDTVGSSLMTAFVDQEILNDSSHNQNMLLAPPKVPAEGQALCFVESSSFLESSYQILAASSSNDQNEGNLRSAKVRRILPKLSPNKAKDLDSLTNSVRGKRQRKRRVPHLNASSNYEICLWENDSINTLEAELVNKCAFPKPFVCEKCGINNETVVFRRFEDLSRHYLRVHRVRLLRNASVICREENCTFKSCRIGELRRHLNLIHGIRMDCQTHEFDSMEEFMEWKTKAEKSSGSQFNRSSGEHSVSRQSGSPSLIYMYYSCHRSGSQRNHTVTEGSKKKRRQTSIKMNGICTASINLIHDKTANKILCEYYPTHYGHDANSPSRQNLSKQEKGWILQLVQRGWNSDEIVKTLRNGTISGTTVRMRRVTRQDVFNVCRSHGVKSFERRDPDDNLSLKLWAEELRSKSSVLIWNNSDENSLLLVVMSESQALLAGLHGRIIYVSDTSLAWERYHRLITISALSATDANAYLLAYAIADRKGVDTLQAVFAAIQAKLVSFQPEFVLAQDPAMVTDTWISNAESFPVFLHPPWKVEKEWNEGLIKYVVDDVQRDAIKKMLDMLLAETNPSKFSASLQLVNAMLTANPNLLAFSRFFTSIYADQATHWARFHPLPDCSPLEQLIAELELIARRSRALKRLDKCIYSLEFIAANQPYEPMTEFRSNSNQQESGKISNLRLGISEQLKALEQIVQHCSDLDTLDRIDKVIQEALH